MKTARFIVGIDLGTTSSLLAYCDTADPSRSVQLLPLTQWEQPGMTATDTQLPSFCYLPAKSEYKNNRLRLPFHEDRPDGSPYDFVVGRMAQNQRSITPDRVISSAKSWLAHRGIDATAKCLPWHSDGIIGDERLSPVATSALYLAHLRQVWDERFARTDPQLRLCKQQVILTVPASFDEVACDLTLQAAGLAGFNPDTVRLLEEPQAAFYSWLHQERLGDKAAGRGGSGTNTVLICDIGGGTTDFSLFTVAEHSDGPCIERIAVSPHILLGGDNIDLQLASMLEQRAVAAGAATCNSRQWAELVHGAQGLKEQALTGNHPDGQELFVSISQRGSSLLQSTWTARLTAGEIRASVCDGFFPRCAPHDRPQQRPSGLKEWGLPFAYDCAITRHLAAFLRNRTVDAVLFAGGTLLPEILQQRLVEVLRQWGSTAVRVLPAADLRSAVACGATVFGLAARGDQQIITGGYPRNLYLRVAGASAREHFLCVVPKGFAENDEVLVEQQLLQVRVGEPVSFDIFSDLTTEGRQLGELCAEVDELVPLSPLQTQLNVPGKNNPRLVDVVLGIRLLPNGLLQVSLHERDGGQTWQLAFALSETSRSSVQSGTPPGMNFAGIDDVIFACFGKTKAGAPVEIAPKGLSRHLEEKSGLPKNAWTLNQLRSLWPALRLTMGKRNRSAQHESAWLHWAGYSLRPGYGDAHDRFRMQQAWELHEQGLAFPREAEVQNQWWILWRRLAGGLTSVQQDRLCDKLYPALRKNEITPEMVMCLGALERLNMKKKVQIGEQLVQHIVSGSTAALPQKIWALTRIAARSPLYGGPETVMRPIFVEQWYVALASLNLLSSPYRGLEQFIVQGGRRLGDRELDLNAVTREQMRKTLSSLGTAPELAESLDHVMPVDVASQQYLFGETLPPGLVLHS